MARNARKQADSGIYHVMLRGIDRVQLFYDVEDRQSFLERIRRFKSASSFKLSDTHYHTFFWGSGETMKPTVNHVPGVYAP